MLALLHLATAGLTLRDAEAAGKAGDFGPLVDLIRTEPGYQDRAAFALGELARSGAQDGIVMAGALEPLVKLLKTGSDGKKENAALAIWLLANNHAGNQEKIGELGAIAPLVEMVRNGDAPSQQKASGALKSLAALLPNKRRIVEAGGVGPLGQLARAGGESAWDAMAKLIGDDDDNRKLATEIGIMPLLAAAEAETVEAVALAAAWCRENRIRTVADIGRHGLAGSLLEALPLEPAKLSKLSKALSKGIGDETCEL